MSMWISQHTPSLANGLRWTDTTLLAEDHSSHLAVTTGLEKFDHTLRPLLHAARYGTHFNDKDVRDILAKVVILVIEYALGTVIRGLPSSYNARRLALHGPLSSDNNLHSFAVEQGQERRAEVDPPDTSHGTNNGPHRILRGFNCRQNSLGGSHVYMIEDFDLDSALGDTPTIPLR